MLRKKLVSALFLSASAWSAQAEAPTHEFSSVLSNEALFIRCYRTITRLEPEFDHPLLIAVQEQQKDPVSACLEVFDQARLSFAESPEPSGARRLELNIEDDSTRRREAVAILNTFGDFFRSWFTFKDWSEIPPNTTDNGLLRTLEMSEETTHLLRALFQGPISGSGIQPYSEIVQGAQSAMAIRTEPDRVPTACCKDGIFDCGSPPFKGTACWSTFPEAGNFQGASTSPGKGEILGIRVFPTEHASYYSLNGSAVATGPGSSIADSNLRNFSGGILGTRALLIKASQYKEASNGGRRMRRRFFKEAFSSLLCRTLPSLRSEDVSGFVNEFNTMPNPPNNTNAKAPLAFRQEATCARCHATIDSASGVLRGLNIAKLATPQYFGWNSFQGSNDDRIANVHFASPSLGSSGIPPHLQLESADFKKEPPMGRLLFRSYDGTLIDHTLNPSSASGADRTPQVKGDDGLAVLGRHLAEGKDLYMCAASRMIEHFTGVTVNLSDPGDVSNPPLTSEDAIFRNWAEKLALDPESGLKSTQSLRMMVEKLLRSDLYRAQGYRREASP